MENTEILNIRISREIKESFEKQARENNQTVSDYVWGVLVRDVLQDGDIVSGIPSDLMAQIESEAKRRGIPATDLISRFILMAWGRLRRDTPANVFILR